MTSGIDKFECTLCHKSARFAGGIIVSPSLRWGMCDEHAPLMPPSDDAYFVRYRQTRVEKINHNVEKETKPTRLAIGLPGGFNPDENDVTYNDEYSAVVRRNSEFVDITVNDDLASSIVENIRAVTDNQQIAMQRAVANLWGGDERVVSKEAYNLEQLPNPPALPEPNVKGEYKCQQEGCEITGNVWLNLSDGTILCGRRQMLSMENIQNGNMHALMHYQNTGKKYPLAVKIGTIDSSGQADVYSYSEKQDVIDPLLQQHLAHFGIDMMKMQKTCRTLEELQVELNLQHDWAAIASADEDHRPVYGPNRTGMVNLGNTCYMNSVMQALAHVDYWKDLYSIDQMSQWATAYSFERIRPLAELNHLVGRLFTSLESGQFSKTPDDKCHPDWLNGINPLAFRRLIGANHPEFATSRQQDAEEFLRHLLDAFERKPPPFQEATLADAFRFKLETRTRDLESGKVCYTQVEDVVLGLPIDETLVENINEIIEYNEMLRQRQAAGMPTREVTPVLARIHIQSLLNLLFTEETVADAISPVSGQRTGVCRRNAPLTLPNYLWVTLRRFKVGDDGITPKKMAIDVIGANQINLEAFRAKGPQAGEQLIDADAVKKASSPPLNPEYVDMIVTMGFAEAQAREAVKQTNNQGAEAALNWLLANPDAISSEMMDTGAADSKSTDGRGKKVVDGRGQYVAKAIVVHLGRNSHSGHYIAFAKDDQTSSQWICYNDEKVYAVPADKVPIEKAYLILYERL